MKEANRSTGAPLRPFLGGVGIGWCLCNVGSYLNGSLSLQQYVVQLSPQTEYDNSSSYMYQTQTQTAENDKMKRWIKYSKKYRYISPASRDDYAQPVPIKQCGTGPDYAPWFQLDIKERSRFHEDKIIYELLFKNSTTTSATTTRSGGGDSGGTYLELGAFNGVQESNTRFFDDCLGWKGLLIEANPGIYQETIENRPFAHKMSFAPSCSAESTVPFHRVKWTNGGLQGYAVAYNNSKAKPTVDVPYKTTTAPVLPTLDFFSLDVEGAEALVLSTIDFQAIRINVLMIEIQNSFCTDNNCEVRRQVRAKMALEGYQRYEGLVRASDVYVHPESRFQIPDSVATPKPIK